LDKAEQLFVQVVDTRKRVFGQNHSDTLTSMAELGKMYKKQNQWKEAEQLEVQGMNSRKSALGEAHPETVDQGFGPVASQVFRAGGLGHEAGGLRPPLASPAPMVLRSIEYE
jgi:hypothetical protein